MAASANNMDLGTVPEWLPGALIAIGGSTLTWWRAAMKAKVAQASSDARTDLEIASLKDQLRRGELRVDREENSFRETLREFDKKLEAAVNEFHSATVTIAKLSSSQEVVNKVTAGSLQSIVDKLDEHQNNISEHGATLRVMAELMTRGECGPSKACWTDEK